MQGGCDISNCQRCLPLFGGRQLRCYHYYRLGYPLPHLTSLSSLLVRGSPRLYSVATASLSVIQVLGFRPTCFPTFIRTFGSPLPGQFKQPHSLSYPAYHIPLAGYIISNALSIAAFRASSRVGYTDLQVLQSLILLLNTPAVYCPIFCRIIGE